HRRAKVLGETLEALPWVAAVRPVQTNIVIFDLAPPLKADQFLKEMEKHGILAAPFGPATIRFVTHLHFDDDMLDRTVGALRAFRP
ncbi:MAG: threonine aldolase, partial [Bacteroidetes bacterium]